MAAYQICGELFRRYRPCPRNPRNPRPRKGLVKRAAGMALGGAIFLLLAGCQVNPVTGKSQFNMLSQQQEIAMGQEQAPEYIKSFGGEIDSAPLRAYVSAIGQKLAGQSELATAMPWRFYALDSDVVNAFALPGGHVCITRGLLAAMKDESELAAVLGHEVAHVTHRHIGQQMTMNMATSYGLIVGGYALGMRGEELKQAYNLGSLAANVTFLLPHSRGAENESDATGLRYMVLAGYDPNGMVAMLNILLEMSKGQAGLMVFSTHPYAGERVKRISQIIAEKYPNTEGAEAKTVLTQRYKQNVLDVLAKLPAAKHQQEKAETTGQ